MNFRQLALNNVKGNWRNYKAFLISSCLSIVVFFMYASFIYHPDVVSGNISMRKMITKGLESMNYIVVIFSALFILYANSTFLRARKKEFGLLTLIGGTIIHEPTLILADEPTGNLDSKSAKSLMGALQDLHEQKKVTIAMVTHDPVAASYCERILFIRDGEIFSEIHKGRTKQAFFQEILDVLAMLGGEYHELSPARA